MHQQTSAGASYGPRSAGVTPPSVLNLNAYLMYATGKAARRRLTDALTAHGLRLRHLTVLSMLEDTGPLSKGDLASRLDMNQSDLTRTVTDLERAEHVTCTRDLSDRRRIEVALTAAGRAPWPGSTTRCPPPRRISSPRSPERNATGSPLCCAVCTPTSNRAGRIRPRTELRKEAVPADPAARSASGTHGRTAHHVSTHPREHDQGIFSPQSDKSTGPSAPRAPTLDQKSGVVNI